MTTKEISEEEAREMIYQYVTKCRPGAVFFNKLVDAIPKERLNNILDTDGLQLCITDGRYKYKVEA